MTKLPPSLDDLDRMARKAWAELPLEFRDLAGDVLIRVEDWADDEVLAGLGIEDPFELTGLYDGIALTEKSVFHQPTRPDIVWLFRRPILDEWAARGDETCARVGGAIARGFVDWLGSQIAVPEDQRRGAAVRLLATIEGAVLLTSLGLGTEIAGLAKA